MDVRLQHNIEAKHTVHPACLTAFPYVAALYDDETNSRPEENKTLGNGRAASASLSLAWSSSPALRRRCQVVVSAVLRTWCIPHLRTCLAYFCTLVLFCAGSCGVMHDRKSTTQNFVFEERAQYLLVGSLASIQMTIRRHLKFARSVDDKRRAHVGENNDSLSCMFMFAPCI